MEKSKTVKKAKTRVAAHTHTSILNNKKTKIQQAGITLVALIVTMVVLLILAGITINLALNDNGVMNKSQFASNIYAMQTKDEFEIMEQIETEIATITTPIIIKDKNGEYINIKEIANYYGHEVMYNEQVYQLFYVDIVGKYSNKEPRIWLQYKEGVGDIQLSQHLETTGIAEENSIFWKINPDLNKKFGTEIRKKNSWSNNLRGVAYLCNPDNWNETYLAEGDSEKGAYAIGGVSAELFCDSYNQIRGKTKADEDYFEAKAFGSNIYGYLYKPLNPSASIQKDGYSYVTNGTNYPISGDIYGTHGGRYKWISSPSFYAYDNVCIKYDAGKSLTRNPTSANLTVRPAVSLPPDIQIQLIN
ncbi:MAG: hypothetical protein IKG14_00735 [Clostridia bacterium]|nr:hypothetical protein [Clostridia bacterium]